MDELHNYEGKLQGTLGRIAADPNLRASDKKLISDYLKSKKARINIAGRTRYRKLVHSHGLNENELDFPGMSYTALVCAKIGRHTRIFAVSNGFKFQANGSRIVVSV